VVVAVSRRAGAAAARAFTLIEVLAALIILSLGLASAIGLVMYGMKILKLSIGRATGMATAMTAAVDAAPLHPAGDPWTTTGGVTKGYLNGYWVERVETDRRVLTAGMESSVVHVDVFETSKGRCVASYSERIVRQAP
jgi:prepilin-type N-terminal cleavage/methylation domain-containing protein